MLTGDATQKKFKSEIIAKVGTVAYRLELPKKLSRVHSTFHVSNLKKCLADEPLAIPLDESKLTTTITLHRRPVDIMTVRSSILSRVVLLIITVH
ncbi:hypothetical protein Tco_0621578 [Tanacetum coccineum]